MSRAVCTSCSKSFDFSLPSSVNVGTHPELKNKVLSGELFLRECPHCGTVNLVKGDMLYIDPSQKLLVCLTDSSLASADEIPDYTCRVVSGVGDLIEKIKISDASLDDVAIEMCKFVTNRETGRDVPLRFYRMDGADNEIILTYPENARMEMLAIGFNVYEDCRGIISRNPVLRESSKGLVRIDREWLEGFLG